MKISEMIAAVGDKNVQIQNLDQCSTALNWSEKKGTRVTFGTTVRLTPDGLEMLGIVVWMPRDQVKDVLAAAAGREEGGT